MLYSVLRVQRPHRIQEVLLSLYFPPFILDLKSVIYQCSIIIIVGRAAKATSVPIASTVIVFSLLFILMLFWDRLLADVSGDCSETEQDNHCSAYQHFIQLLSSEFRVVSFTVSLVYHTDLCKFFAQPSPGFPCGALAPSGISLCCDYIVSYRPFQDLCRLSYPTVLCTCAVFGELGA